MITIDIRSNIKEVVNRFANTTPTAVNNAAFFAVNKTATGARVRMQRAITESYALPAAFVRARLSVTRARRNAYAIEAKLIGGGKNRRRSMNLIQFAIDKLSVAEKRAWRQQQSNGSKFSRPQIPFQIRRSGGRVYVKGAFVGNDGRTVFARTGTGRLPIKPVQTIGVEQMFTATRSINAVQSWIKANFAKNFEHELRYQLSKQK